MGFQCRLCNGDRLEPVFTDVPDRVRRRGSYTYGRCRACCLLQIAEIPSDLDSAYTDYRVHARESPLYAALRRLTIGSCYDFTSGGGRLLDYGCGNGWYMRAMAARGWRPTGFEPDPDLARNLRRELGFEVLTSPDDLADRPGEFDLITLNFSFEHLVEPRATLTMLAGCLRPGGRLRVSVPDPAGREARLFGRNWFHLDPPRHIALFERAQLTELLQRAGFVDIAVRSLRAPTGFAGSVSYLLTGRFTPATWYAAVPAGLAFAGLVPDGLYAASATKPA